MEILLVSSNPHVSAQVNSALVGEPDVNVFEVVTPQRALALLDEGRACDLLIADADTAPTGGFALAREIKARADMDRTVPPVVLLIARDADRYLAKWFRADAYVRKPADPFHLAAVARALVAGEEPPSLPGVGSAHGELPSDLVGLEAGAAGSAGGPL